MRRTPGRRQQLRTGDEELVAAARGGDRAAVEALLRRHHDRIHLICRRICVDRGDAEDATQDALVSIVRGLPRFDGRSEFSTWAHRIATNAGLDQLRRRSRRPLPIDTSEDSRDPSSGGAADLPLDHEADPAIRAVTAEDRARLEQALAALPEEFRVPVVLRDVVDLDYVEIGRLLELPPGTVRSRISRGRSRLAVLLADLRPQPSPDATATAGSFGGTASRELGNHAVLPDVRPGDAT